MGEVDLRDAQRLDILHAHPPGIAALLWFDKDIVAFWLNFVKIYEFRQLPYRAACRILALGLRKRHWRI